MSYELITRTHIMWVESLPDPVTTQRCKFLSQEVRETRAFFVAPPRVFPLSLLRSRNSGLLRIIHTLVHITLFTRPRVCSRW